MTRRPLDGRVAVVTGANHGIGAATAAELARLGADVLVTYLAFTPDDDDPGRPEVYRTAREQGPEAAVRAVRSARRLRPCGSPPHRRARVVGQTTRTPMGPRGEPHIRRFGRVPRRSLLRSSQGRSRELHDDPPRHRECHPAPLRPAPRSSPAVQRECTPSNTMSTARSILLVTAVIEC